MSSRWRQACCARKRYTEKTMQFAQRPRISLRTVQASDAPALVALNRAAYPDLAEQDVVFTEEQLRAHASIFPRGQIVAEIDGSIVGAIATLILPASFDALAQHTWSEATGGGLFTTHDPRGATLYLADVYVAHAAWGRGVGTALYGALRELCRSLHLERIVAGGRLWGYHAVAHERTPPEYIADVMAGVRLDRVLTGQLKAGFALRGVLSGYLPDPKSCDFASLLEWVNSPAAGESVVADEPVGVSDRLAPHASRDLACVERDGGS